MIVSVELDADEAAKMAELFARSPNVTVNTVFAASLQALSAEAQGPQQSSLIAAQNKLLEQLGHQGLSVASFATSRSAAQTDQTAAGVLSIIVALDAVQSDGITVIGLTRRSIPEATRQMMRQAGVAEPMLKRICGTAGRMAAHAGIYKALRTGNFVKIVEACDEVLKDGRDGLVSHRRLDEIGK